MSGLALALRLVTHSHLDQKQGDTARYLGERANLFDLRRTSAVLNLEVIHHELAEAA